MCECVGREKVDFLENKRRHAEMRWMVIPVWDAKWCAHTFVVEQEGWEISILSQLRTELMCHLT